MNDGFNNYNKEELGFLEPFLSAVGFIPAEKGNYHNNKMMKTDIEENDNAFKVMVDLPGVKKEEIKLSLDKGYLNVSYEQKEEVENKQKHNYVRKERYFTSGSRSFYLGDVDSSKVEASMENGVLNITVPKLQKDETNKYIQIK